MEASEEEKVRRGVVEGGVLRLDLKYLRKAGVQQLARALIDAPENSLVAIHLKGNALGSEGCLADLADGLSRTRCGVKTLSLSWNGITPNGFELFVEKALVHSNSNLRTTLTELDLSENPDFAKEGISALLVAVGNAPHLKCIDISSCNIGVEGITLLLESLVATNASLWSLNLARNGIKDQGASMFAEVLSNASTSISPSPSVVHLKSLNLEENEIGSEGAEKIAIALTHMSNLESINLAGNNIGIDGIKRMVVVLQSKKDQPLRLVSADFSNNSINLLKESEKDTSLQSFVSALIESTTQGDGYSFSNLTIRGNPLGPRGAKQLTEAFSTRCVEFLNMRGTQCGDEGAQAIASLIRSMNKSAKKLKSIDLGSNRITEDGWLFDCLLSSLFEGAKAIASAVMDDDTASLLAVNLERNLKISSRTLALLSDALEDNTEASRNIAIRLNSS